MDIRDLEAFLIILDSGSLSRASIEIGLTQPALSLKLKKMEQELGVSLFQRTTRSMVPLETARLIAPRARDIIAQLDSIKESLAESVSDLKGNVRVGCLAGWYDALLIPAVSLVRESAPQIRLRLHINQTENLIFEVAHGRLDLAVIAQPFEQTDDIQCERILDEKLVLIGNNLPYTANKEERKQLLMQRPWVTMTVPDPIVDKWWKAQFNGESFPWEQSITSVTTDHITSMPSIVSSITNAVAVIPLQIMHGNACYSNLTVADSIPGHNELYLIWRKNGLELERYKLVKNKIMEQAQNYLSKI